MTTRPYQGLCFAVRLDGTQCPERAKKEIDRYPYCKRHAAFYRRQKYQRIERKIRRVLTNKWSRAVVFVITIALVMWSDSFRAINAAAAAYILGCMDTLEET